MAKLYNLARMTTLTTGTGTMTLGSAVSGYLSFASAGVANADVVFYGISDGNASEVGYGTYTSSGTTLTRTVIKSTNSNSAITLSGSAQVYITALASDGGDLLRSSSNPLLGFDSPVNLQLSASVATNILTVAVKGNNGSDPSATNPVLIPFRDPTIANGGPVWRAVTSALSITTNATGATLGTANSVPFRLWVVAFDNSGTVVLALWQSVTGGASPTAISALNEASVASSTAISGTATAAATFYTPNGTTVTSKSFRVLGYVEYGSGLTTAGTYASAPTTVQLFGPGGKLPGSVVQTSFAIKTDTSTHTNTTYADVTGLSATINVTSAPNSVLAVANVSGTDNGAQGRNFFRFVRGSTAFGLGAVAGSRTQCSFGAFSCEGGGFNFASAAGVSIDAPGAAGSTTYKVQIQTDGTTIYINRSGTDTDGAAYGRAASTLTIQEIMS